MRKIALPIASVAISLAISPIMFGGDLVTSDTLDLDVTFIGDREVSLQDAHKELHWPEPAKLNKPKPVFQYAVLPKRINVQPEWTKQGPIRLKIEQPLPRLYKGFVEAGMGNYISPYVRIGYSELRSRKGSWGVEALHESTNGGFLPSDSIDQLFSTNHFDAYLKRFHKNEAITLRSQFVRNHISPYGAVNDLSEIDETPSHATNIHVWSNNAILENFDSNRKWNHRAELDYHYLWTNADATEHNFDVQILMSGEVESTPIQLEFHTNIDRLSRWSEGAPKHTARQAIFDLHPRIQSQFGPIKTEYGMGLWVDAQGKRPFSFVPEVSASMSLLRDLFIPYIRINGGVNQNRYETALTSNPFITSPSDSSTTFQNTYEKILLEGGMRGSITEALAFQISASHGRFDQFMLWGPANPYGNGTWYQPIYMDLNRTQFQGNTTLKIKESATLFAQVTTNTYATDDTTFSAGQAWNLPTFELEVDYVHTIKEKIRIQNQLLFQSGRLGLNASDGQEPSETIFSNSGDLIGYEYTLDNFLMWNLQLEYIYNARLNGWLKINNILNQDNPLFLGYNSQGIRFQMGANLAF